jgi:Phosphotransferase enzyme family
MIVKIKLSSNNVSQYLVDVGICQEQDIKLIKINPKCSSGSNNLIFLTIYLPNRLQLFVKQENNYLNNNKTNIIQCEQRLHSFLQRLPSLNQTHLLVKILHFDESNFILIYQESNNYVNLETSYKKNNVFPVAIAELLGANLANLHRESLNSQTCYNFMNEAPDGKCNYQFPHPSYLLGRIGAETLIKEFPPEGNRFMAFYHSSETLMNAVIELVENRYDYCLTHNDFELNNILIWQNTSSQITKSDEKLIKVINWEKSSWGEPAFDVGTAIASYLLLWLRSLIAHPAIKFELSLQLAIIPLEAIQPSIVALTSSYINSFPKVLEDFPDFLIRVIRFTGLSLLYKVIASIQSFQGFDNREICILQLVKSLLCQPEKSFISIFGMTEVEFMKLISSSTINQNYLIVN